VAQKQKAALGVGRLQFPNSKRRFNDRPDILVEPIPSVSNLTPLVISISKFRPSIFIFFEINKARPFVVFKAILFPDLFELVYDDS